MARKNIKNKTEEYNLTNAVRNTAKNINAFVVETSENMIDEAIEGGIKWQGVSERAIKGGLKLAEIQQDIAFKALETLKSSLIKGGSRFKSVLSN